MAETAGEAIARAAGVVIDAVREPVLSECRYLATHDRWFWTVEVANPAPIRNPDGQVNLFDRRLYESGCATPNRIGRPTRRRDREVERAKRRLTRKVTKAMRMMEADES